MSETFQHTGSFKFRAAFNLAGNVAQPHIIAASAGNFGQALACACALFAKRCTVVMPASAASTKVEAVKAYGGTVELIDTRQVSREQRVAELAALDPQAFVASAYDDELVIEGNAGLGRELAALDPPLDAIIVPVGGGGLAAGVARGLRTAGKSWPLFGAEPALANDAARSLRCGRLCSLEAEPQTIADGARVRSLGRRTWPVLREELVSIVEASEDDIKSAVRLLFSLANLKSEPTGALAVAALLAQPDKFAAQRVCCIVSGGNVDPDLYARVLLAGT